MDWNVVIERNRERLRETFAKLVATAGFAACQGILQRRRPRVPSPCGEGTGVRGYDDGDDHPRPITARSWRCCGPAEFAVRCAGDHRRARSGPAWPRPRKPRLNLISIRAPWRDVPVSSTARHEAWAISRRTSPSLQAAPTCCRSPTGCAPAAVRPPQPRIWTPRLRRWVSSPGPPGPAGLYLVDGHASPAPALRPRAGRDLLQREALQFAGATASPHETSTTLAAPTRYMFRPSPGGGRSQHMRFNEVLADLFSISPTGR